MKRKIVLNRIQTPDGTILVSKHVHDFVEHTDKNGEYYFLDGGPEYQRTSVNKEPAKDVSIYSDASFEIIRQNCLRGTFDETDARVWKPIAQLSNAHLLNILEYNKMWGLSNSLQEKFVKQELEYREKFGIFIADNWDGQRF